MVGLDFQQPYFLLLIQDQVYCHIAKTMSVILKGLQGLEADVHGLVYLIPCRLLIQAKYQFQTLFLMQGPVSVSGVCDNAVLIGNPGIKTPVLPLPVLVFLEKNPIINFAPLINKGDLLLDQVVAAQQIREELLQAAGRIGGTCWPTPTAILGKPGMAIISLKESELGS